MTELIQKIYTNTLYFENVIYVLAGGLAGIVKIKYLSLYNYQNMVGMGETETLIGGPID